MRSRRRHSAFAVIDHLAETQVEATAAIGALPVEAGTPDRLIIARKLKTGIVSAR